MTSSKALLSPSRPLWNAPALRTSLSSSTTARASPHRPARSSASASAAAKERNSSYRRKHWKQENKKEAEKNSESQKDVFVSDVEKQEWGEQEDNSDYELKNIEIKSEEREEILEKLQLVAEKCKPIYIQADKGEASNIVLEEEDVHQMIECIAEAGYPIGCGGDDYNMQNYESVHDKLIQAKKGYDTETEFYVINSMNLKAS